jgi:hypothetical protein
MSLVPLLSRGTERPSLYKLTALIPDSERELISETVIEDAVRFMNQLREGQKRGTF